jgi:ribulose-phosphate 3-epimerase
MEPSKFSAPSASPASFFASFALFAVKVLPLGSVKYLTMDTQRQPLVRGSVRPQIVPSILAADFGHLADEIDAVVEAGADRIQIDIMDGHFVPNISMGPMFVATVRKLTSLPLEAHLMVDRPQDWIIQVADAGADLIIVHAEATSHLHRMAESIIETGARPGVALNPASPLVLIEPILTYIDLALMMTVNPGWGGQSFIVSVLPKIRELRDRLEADELRCDIEVDGGVDAQNIAKARTAGADVFVAGSSVFNYPQGAAAGVKALRTALAPPSVAEPRPKPVRRPASH